MYLRSFSPTVQSTVTDMPFTSACFTFWCTGASFVAMMFYTPHLSVVLATVHVPLAEVPRLLTRDLAERVIRLTSRELPRFGVPAPRLAVAGLNPHAGEHGLFGDEDQEFIVPAIQAACAKGIECSGPHAADTVFLQASRGAYDLVVAMYHDQGHIPMKLLDFEGTVNISLGIPIVRTSVDHGTAFDIAGTNQADPRSMKQAMRMAARMAVARRGPASERT